MPCRPPRVGAGPGSGSAWRQRSGRYPQVATRSQRARTRPGHTSGVKERVIKLLDEGRGVLTAKQLASMGIGPAVLRTLLREGTIRRVARGAYAKSAPSNPDTTAATPAARARAAEADHLTRLDALLLSYRPKVAASHQSAALAWGMPVWRTLLDRVHLSYRRTGATTRKHDAFTIHRCQHEDAFTFHEGRPVVVAPLAVVGTAVEGGLRAGLITADGALRTGLTTKEQLETWVSRLRHHPGLSSARAVLEHCDGSAESPGESLLRLTLVQLGVRFEAQHWIRVSDGSSYRVDFYLPDHGVVLEFDGAVKYSSGAHGDPTHDGADALVAEKVREDALRAEGYGVGRVTWSGLAAGTLAQVILVASRQAQPRARHHVSTPPDWWGR